MSVYDSYQLFEIIGRTHGENIDGSSCTVKRAVRKDSQQVFAAKLYQADFLSAKNQIEMLVRLDHPNIVNIYEVFEEEDCIILILQYMQGGELYDYVGQKESITEQQVREYMKIIVDAIRYCHQMNVVHRDIKPENLLLTSNTPQGLLKLADFGISKIMSDQMLTTNCGTPIYMAPEIWSGKAYDSKVDVWSLGVIMYYMLSGTHPFMGDTESMGQRIQFDQLEFTEGVWTKISCKAIDLLRKLLEKDPNRRFSAVQATGHIWFSYIQPIYTSAECSQQESDQPKLKLIQPVRKIRRFNLKRKVKKTHQKLKSLMSFQLLPYSHQFFIKQESTSPTLLSSTQAEDTFSQQERVTRDVIDQSDMEIQFIQV